MYTFPPTFDYFSAHFSCKQHNIHNNQHKTIFINQKSIKVTFSVTGVAKCTINTFLSAKNISNVILFFKKTLLNVCNNARNTKKN